MLSYAKLPMTFWGEVMHTTVYLINMSPSTPLNGEVPEVWTGQDPSYSYIRVFGCRASVHVLKDERSKLDMKIKQCVFLGYDDEKFGYKLWDLTEKKLVRSRDVVFFEDQCIEDIGKQEKNQLSSSELEDMDTIIPPMVPDDGGVQQGVEDEGVPIEDGVGE